MTPFVPCCGFECACTLQCHEAINKRIPDWLASCSEPNELPDESAILLEVRKLHLLEIIYIYNYVTKYAKRVFHTHPLGGP